MHILILLIKWSLRHPKVRNPGKTGAMIEAAAWKGIVRNTTETRETDKKHLFDPGGKIGVAAQSV